MNEKETRIQNIDPMLKESGWSDSNNPDVPSFKREHYFTDGKIRGEKVRGKAKRADYLLYYRRPHFPIAVVHVKKHLYNSRKTLWISSVASVSSSLSTLNVRVGS